MGKLLVIEPYAIAVADMAFGSDEENLLDPDPKMVWRGGAAGYYNCDIDLGAAVSVDSFFWGFTNADDAQMEVFSATGMGTGLVSVSAISDVKAADAVGSRPHGFRHLPTPVTSRYWRMTYRTISEAEALIGILILGLAVQTEWGPEWGKGRRVIDTGQATPLRGGGFGIEEGAKKANFRWTFGDLTDAETQALYAMQLRLGQTSPLLVVEDPDATVGRNEGIHYGLFRNLQQFERREPQATKWQLEIEQWV